MERRMKPILFSSDMSYKVNINLKVETRRLVKCPGHIVTDIPANMLSIEGFWFSVLQEFTEPSARTATVTRIIPPYLPGDILYVREAWCNANKPGFPPDYYYRADMYDSEDYDPSEWEWRPSIHMPKEIARTFLRVTYVRPHRIADVTEIEAKRDGFGAEGGLTSRDWFMVWWEAHYNKILPVKQGGVVTHYIQYPWKDYNGDGRPRIDTHKGKPLLVIPNPYVWAYGFEKITKEEALRNA